MLPCRRFFLFLFIAVLQASFVWGYEKKLEVACDSDWPPYEFIKDGSLAGFATETVSAVLNRMGKGFNITPYPWKRAISYATIGKVDAVFSASTEPGRVKACYYPETHLFKSTYVFFIWVGLC